MRLAVLSVASVTCLLSTSAPAILKIFTAFTVFKQFNASHLQALAPVPQNRFFCIFYIKLVRMWIVFFNLFKARQR